MKRCQLFTDGGSRGNPGPSAAGYVIFELSPKGEQGDKVFEEGVYMGITTNNQAEYTAIILGLKKAKELGYEAVDCKMDSELAVKQLNGQYRVKNPEIAKRFLEIHNLKQHFHEIKFTHVRREFNELADAMVNKALDEEVGSRS